MKKLFVVVCMAVSLLFAPIAIADEDPIMCPCRGCSKIATECGCPAAQEALGK